MHGSRADLALLGLFGDKRTGRYIEICAAAEGENTITKLLAANGWNGWVIDNGLYTQDYCLERPHAEVFAVDTQSDALDSEAFPESLGDVPVDVLHLGRDAQPASVLHRLRSWRFIPAVVLIDPEAPALDAAHEVAQELGYQVAHEDDMLVVYATLADVARVRESFGAVGPQRISEWQAAKALGKVSALTIDRDALESVVRLELGRQASLRADLGEARSSVDELRKELAARAAEVAGYRAWVSELEDAVAEGEGLVSALRAELVAERADRRRQADSMRETITRLQELRSTEMRADLAAHLNAPSGSLQDPSELSKLSFSTSSTSRAIDDSGTGLNVDSFAAQLESDAFILLCDRPPSLSTSSADRWVVVVDARGASDQIAVSVGQILRLVQRIDTSAEVVLLGTGSDDRVEARLGHVRSGASAYSIAPGRVRAYIAVGPERVSITRAVPFLLDPGVKSLAVTLPTQPQDGSLGHKRLDPYDAVCSPSGVTDLELFLQDQIASKLPAQLADQRQSSVDSRSVCIVGEPSSPVVHALREANAYDPTLSDVVNLVGKSDVQAGLGPNAAFVFMLGRLDDSEILSYARELGGAVVVDDFDPSTAAEPAVEGSGWPAADRRAGGQLEALVSTEAIDRIFTHGALAAEQLRRQLGVEVDTQHVFAAAPASFSRLSKSVYESARSELSPLAGTHVVVVGRPGTAACPVDVLVELAMQTVALDPTAVFHLVEPAHPEIGAALANLAQRHQVTAAIRSGPVAESQRGLLEAGADIVVGLADEPAGAMPWSLAPWVAHGIPCLAPRLAASALGEVGYVHALAERSLPALASQIARLAGQRRNNTAAIETERSRWLTGHSPRAYLAGLVRQPL